MALALRLIPYPRLPEPSPAELDALRWSLVNGSRKGAAADLNLGERTIGRRLSALYQRINVLDRAQAVAWMDDNYPGWRERMPA